MLQPQIIHQFKSAVWRLDIDPLSETLFAEIRDEGNKTVSFADIDLETGKVLFEELQTEERWLTGIEAAYNGVLLIHNYQSETSPTHKGLIAIDGTNGKILWSNYIYTFDHLSVNGPVIYDARIQPRKLFLVDTKTGASIRPYDPSMDTELTNNVVLPYSVSSDFLVSLPIVESPFGNTVHYLDHNNLRIVSLHTIVGETLQQHLYIMDNSTIIYQDLLNTAIQKLQPESFLLYKNYLIYLKNKSQLKVLSL